MSFRDLAAHFADKFADDIRLERKGEAKRDKTGYRIGEGEAQSFKIRGRILSSFTGVGYNDATKIRGLRLQVPISCGFNDFCVGDKIYMLCGPYEGMCFSVSGGNGNSIAQIQGAFLEIDVVQS